MSSEVMFAAAVVAVLLAGAVLLGRWVAGRVTARPLPVTGVVVLATLALAMLGGRLWEAAVAVVLWAVPTILIAAVATRLRRGGALAVGLIGGYVAVHAAVVAYVLVRFTADEAPREYALAWLPAILGAVRELGESGAGTETPLWVRVSQAAGPLLLLLTVSTGFAVAHAIRRSGRSEIEAAPAVAA